VLQSTSGQIYTCGSNQYGQLGIENNLQNVYSPTLVSSVTGATHLTTGEYQVIVVNGSEIVSWGQNSDGCLGFNLTHGQEPIPQLISSLVGVEIAQIVSSYGVETSFAIARNGTGYGWGDSNYYFFGNLYFSSVYFPFALASSLNPVELIAPGANDVIFLSGHQKLAYGVGQNSVGELGLGNNLAQTSWQHFHHLVIRPCLVVPRIVCF